MPVYTGASGSSATQSVSSSTSQPGSLTFTNRMAMLPAIAQKILDVYSGNTRESWLLALERLEADLRNHPGEDWIRVTRRAGTNSRPGGIEIANCRDCLFSGTFQKVAEHVISKHWGLSLWSCEATSCELRYRRRHDLSRHHLEAHNIHTRRHAKKIAADALRAGGHATSQSTQADTTHSTQNLHTQHHYHTSMSSIGSSSEPFDGESSSSSSPTAPAPPGSTTSPSVPVYQYQSGSDHQHQSLFGSPATASHTIPSAQPRDGYTHAPRTSHDQPRVEFYPSTYAMGGMYSAQQPTPQTLRPHPINLGNQATPSVRDRNEAVLDHTTGRPSLAGSSNDMSRYWNEGKNVSAQHWHAIRTVCGGRSYAPGNWAYRQ